MSRPACSMRPALCTSRPAMMRSRVVLPQPEGPRKQTNSPCAMSRSMLFRALKLPKSLRIPASFRNGLSPGTRSTLLGLGVVALGPLGQDALAILGGDREVHLHQPGLVILRHVGERLGDAWLCGDREVLAIQQ